LRKIISNDAKTIDILVAEVDGQRGAGGMENLNSLKSNVFASLRH
jgi:hypothetical protein